jgi:hypothetical protein
MLPDEADTQSDSAGQMPTRSRERRGPFCLQGRRTEGVAWATACPTAVHRRRVKRARYWGCGTGSIPTLRQRPPWVSRSGSSRPKPQLRRQHLVIDPRVPQEPVEPIQGTAPLNPRPGGATRPEPPRPRPPSPERGYSAGSGERGLANSSTWGIVPWGPWVSCGGWGYNSHRRRPACPLPTPKVISGQEDGHLTGRPGTPMLIYDGGD